MGKIFLIIHYANEMWVGKQKVPEFQLKYETRENSFLGDPWQSVTVAKQRRIIKATNRYIIENQIDLECRFDIISIVHNQKHTNLEHLEEAFYPLV